ncbi:MAG: hypothetical protein IJS20_00090 [Bacteroidales bacterium]|nr:hypothetical protein [Bacteroidales bacterium]
MNTAFIIAVSLGVAIVIVILMLVAVVVYQRWRISDNNVHLERFITENTELREKLNRYYSDNQQYYYKQPKRKE